MCSTKCKVLLVFFTCIPTAAVERIGYVNVGDVEKKALDIQTDGAGCDVYIPNFIREPIPQTDLKTGTFYVVRMKAAKPGHTKSIGYITWSWKRNPANHKYIYADWHNDLEDYSVGQRWYQDSHWAFLKSRQAGWYHLINCAYPSYYATWSNLKVENDGSGEYPFIISPDYPGNHAKTDFLFKPVKMKKEGARVFQLVTKAFSEGLVLVSNTTYSKESTFLQVESRKIWEDQVNKKGRQLEEMALFVFENTKDKDGVNPLYADEDDQCSCVKSVLIAVSVTILSWLIFTMGWFKRNATVEIIKHLKAIKT